MATENDKVNTGALATLVAVGTAAMIGVSLAVNALVRHEVGSISAERDAVGADAYRALKQQQLDKLTAPAAWSNRDKGEVSIPIERAMNLVLTDLKRNPWNATPAPPPDAGADAAMETTDAGADAAPSDTDAGATPEPSAAPPLSPSAAPTASTAPTAPGSAPLPQPSAAPMPAGSVQPVPRPLQTTAPKPPAPPTPPSTQPPATP